MGKPVIFFRRATLLLALALVALHLASALDGTCTAAAPSGGFGAKAPQLLLDREYYQTLLTGIGGARQEIVLVAFLFKTTDNRRNRPAAVIRKLIEARGRGVRVEVVLENSRYDEALNRENQKVADLLQRNNILVRFDSAGKTTHAKLVVIDRRYILLGSHNLTHSALSSNHEVSALIDNRTMAEKLLDYIKGL